jgi:hypothetical protein
MADMTLRPGDQGYVPTPSLLVVPSYADYTTAQMYPRMGGYDTKRDAARHMLASGTLARSFSPETAMLLGKLHEWKSSPLAALKYALGIGKMPRDYEYDLHNNALGAALAKKARDQAHLEALVRAAAEQSVVGMVPGRPALPPVEKARGGLAQMKECNCG